MNYAKASDAELVMEFQNADTAVRDAMRWRKDVQHEINRRCRKAGCVELAGPSLEEDYTTCYVPYRPETYGAAHGPNTQA